MQAGSDPRGHVALSLCLMFFSLGLCVPCTGMGKGWVKGFKCRPEGPKILILFSVLPPKLPSELDSLPLSVLQFTHL